MAGDVRKLGIGIQDFKKLREGGYVYVDKTEYLYRLVSLSTPFFLSRPRRFGKSLFLSMLRYYWEGEKGLFEGLVIEKLLADDAHAWEPYPVFYFDFNKNNYSVDMALEVVLDDHLSNWEQKYGINEKKEAFSVRFGNVLKTAYEQTGKRCVILVDEYDKPLLEVMTDEDKTEHNRQVFKGFFSVLKSYDSYIQFVFITGVTKFSKVSIFSDLNNLRDISMSAEYAGICGITEAELHNDLMEEVRECGKENGMSETECLEVLKRTYDGYRFNIRAEGVYNPFSLLTALADRNFGYHWFETGTPTFLVKQLRKINFDPAQITDGKIYATEQQLKDYRTDNPNPVPLLYQSGYLTLKDYDSRFRSFQLDYPNDEVKYGFIESLAPDYVGTQEGGSPLDIRSFCIDLENGDTDSLRDRFTAIYARLPYGSGDYLERDFQNVIYIVFMLMGQFVQAEVHSAKGRADVVVETKDRVYLFEFKRDKSAKEALAQIEEMGYADRYAADPRTVIKIGANFDSDKRALTGWETVR